MADLCSAVQAINDLIVRIERMENSSEIGSIVLRLDFINRMLVSLDVPDDIVNTTSALYVTVVAINRENHQTQAARGYQVQLHRTGARGRPSFEITREQLTFFFGPRLQSATNQRYVEPDNHRRLVFCVFSDSRDRLPHRSRTKQSIDAKSHAFGVRLTLFDPISRYHAIETKYHAFSNYCKLMKKS